MCSRALPMPLPFIGLTRVVAKGASEGKGKGKGKGRGKEDERISGHAPCPPAHRVANRA